MLLKYVILSKVVLIVVKFIEISWQPYAHLISIAGCYSLANINDAQK